MTIGLPGHNRSDWTWRPPRERWFTYLWLGLLLDLSFVVVYGGTNLFNQARSEHLQLYLAWEPAIPLVPLFIYPYFAVFLLFLLPPFALAPRALRYLAGQLLVATLVAGALFLLLPARLGYEPVSTDLPELFALLHRFDLPYNLVPSLHVTYSSLIILAISRYLSFGPRLFFALWLAIMCVSVVLVHQHHLLDVIGGLALAALISRFVNKW